MTRLLIILILALVAHVANADITFDVYTAAEAAPATTPLPAHSMFDAMQARLAGAGRQLFVKQSAADATLVRQGESHEFNNGLFETVYEAWANHYSLSFSPDHFWLAIMQGFGLHVNKNIATLRSMFVDFEGQETLRVDVNCVPADDAAWESVFASFSSGIREHIGAETYDTVTPDFSTTGPVEKAVAAITLMDALQKLFKYVIMVGCGIPKVTLQGTADDWRALRTKANALRRFSLDWWLDELDPILEQLVLSAEGNADVDFWKGIVSQYNPSVYMSRTTITGWISVFFPYLKGETSGAPVSTPVSTPQGLQFESTLVRNPHLNVWREFRGERVEIVKDVDPFGNCQRICKSFLGTCAPLVGGERCETGATGAVCERFTSGFEPNEIPNGFASAPVRVDGEIPEELHLRFFGGFAGTTQDPKTLALSPAITYAVVFDPAHPLPNDLTPYPEASETVHDAVVTGGVPDSCFDGIMNGDEGGVDCEGSRCPFQCGEQCVAFSSAGTSFATGHSLFGAVYSDVSTEEVNLYWDAVPAGELTYPEYAAFVQRGGLRLRLAICHECDADIADAWRVLVTPPAANDLVEVYRASRRGFMGLFGNYMRIDAAQTMWNGSIAPQEWVSARAACSQPMPPPIPVMQKCVEIAVTDGLSSDHTIVQQYELIETPAIESPNGDPRGLSCCGSTRRFFWGHYKGKTNDKLYLRISAINAPINKWVLALDPKLFESQTGGFDADFIANPLANAMFIGSNEGAASLLAPGNLQRRAGGLATSISSSFADVSYFARAQTLSITPCVATEDVDASGADSVIDDSDAPSLAEPNADSGAAVSGDVDASGTDSVIDDNAATLLAESNADATVSSESGVGAGDGNTDDNGVPATGNGGEGLLDAGTGGNTTSQKSSESDDIPVVAIAAGCSATLVVGLLIWLLCRRRRQGSATSSKGDIEAKQEDVMRGEAHDDIEGEAGEANEPGVGIISEGTTRGSFRV